VFLMRRRGVNSCILFLTTENVEQDRRPERMAYEANFTSEIWVPLSKEVVNSIRFSKNNVANVLPVRALVKENVQS
jgi:hypothetical protein